MRIAVYLTFTPSIKNLARTVCAVVPRVIEFQALDNRQSQTETGSPKQGRKKVVILSSSPRKGGNSDLLCDKFMEGALAAGHEVEKIFLNDLTIRFLLTNDDYEDRTGVPPPEDDAPQVVDKMIEADVIVMATPTSKEKGMIFGNDVSSAGDVVGKPVMQEAYEMGRSV